MLIYCPHGEQKAHPYDALSSGDAAALARAKAAELLNCFDPTAAFGLGVDRHQVKTLCDEIAILAGRVSP